jgi:hypothetical protein
MAPGQQGYYFMLILAAGSARMNPVNGQWTTANQFGAQGQDNWFNNPVSSTQLEICWIQHQPGPVCTYPIDKDFEQNLDECKRYFQKSWDLPVSVPSLGYPGLCYGIGNGTNKVRCFERFQQEMFTAPNVTLYTQGSLKNQCTLDLNPNVDVSLSAPLTVSTKGIQDITISRTCPVGTPVFFHYAADTGI